MRNNKLRLQIINKFESQADFSGIAEVDETLVSKIVNGRRRLSPEQQQRWAGLLGCSTDIFED